MAGMDVPNQNVLTVANLWQSQCILQLSRACDKMPANRAKGAQVPGQPPFKQQNVAQEICWQGRVLIETGEQNFQISVVNTTEIPNCRIVGLQKLWRHRLTTCIHGQVSTKVTCTINPWKVCRAPNNIRAKAHMV